MEVLENWESLTIESSRKNVTEFRVSDIPLASPQRGEYRSPATRFLASQKAIAEFSNALSRGGESTLDHTRCHF
jgi:hypothetical protein